MLICSRGWQELLRDIDVNLPFAGYDINVVEIIDPKAVAKGVAPKASPAAAPTTAAPPPSPADLAEITASAQREAMRRYPALAIKDSLENAAFVATYNQLKETGGTDFFANPEWPIELAELLAKREGWNRSGRPMTTGPAPVLDPPRGEPSPDSDVDAGVPRSNRPSR